MTTGMQQLADSRWYFRYLNALDAREVLEHYGAENITEMPGGEGTTELVHSCLLDRVDPHHKNGDANPSASVNVEKRKFICYASKWRGDLFQLIMKMEGKESFSEALLAVSDLICAGADDEKSFKSKLTQTISAPGAYAIALPDYGISILNPWRQWSMPHPYLTHRGITSEVVDLLQLGWDDRENRIVFPHFFKGKLVGFQKRAIPGWDMSQVPPVRFSWPATEEPEPKYRSSRGFPKSETLYGYDLCGGFSQRLQASVVVVESPFSVAKAYSLGVPNVVATFGSKVSDNQMALLGDFASVTVWFDHDPAGRDGERHLVEGLPLHKVRVVDPDWGKDMADYQTAEEIRFKLSQAVPAFMKRARYDTENLRRGMH